MNIITEVSPVIAVILLGVIVWLLGAIAWLLWSYCNAKMQVLLPVEPSRQIDELKAAAQHYADVSAVVEMMRQLDELDEDAVALLKSYPETVRAAAWLHYTNVLGADLQHAQKQLSMAHQTYQRADSHNVKAAQAHVDSVRAKLDHAVQLSGQSGLHAI